MRILFAMRHNGYVRNWEWVLRELLSRGHDVHLAFELDKERRDIVERLESEYERLSHGPLPARQGPLALLARRVGGGIDYLRYFEPEYRDAAKLRARARRGAPMLLRFLGWLGVLRSKRVRTFLDRLYRRIESSIPSDDAVVQMIEEGRYDVVMATPLVSSAVQHDYLRTAQRLGRFTVLPVTSWDNLTNKGLVRVDPDRVYVWNEAQRQEAITMHGLAPASVVAVGAHTYDHWFRWTQTRSYEELCAEAGLDPGRPFVLYVCSSGFIMADERPIVRRWIEALRASKHPSLREAGVLVRPHPRTGKVWEATGLEDLDNVAVWPPLGADPRNDDARAAYYDSLSHARVVVGLNTSALVEAAIVGRASYTVLLPETKPTQEGTLHFRHLVRENGGPLSVAATLDEHFDQLAEAFEHPERVDEAVRRFVSSFVRPWGLDRPCAPLLVDDLEAAFASETPGAGSSPGRGGAAIARTYAWLGAGPRIPRPPSPRREHATTSCAEERTKGPNKRRRKAGPSNVRAARRWLRRGRKRIVRGAILAARPVRRRMRKGVRTVKRWAFALGGAVGPEFVKKRLRPWLGLEVPDAGAPTSATQPPAPMGAGGHGASADSARLVSSAGVARPRKNAP